MVVRIRITVDQEEYGALLELALAEMRNVQDQVRFIIRKELEQRRLLQHKYRDNVSDCGGTHGKP